MLPEPVVVPKVLVVEDHPNVRLACEQAMQLAGRQRLTAVMWQNLQVRRLLRFRAMNSPRSF
jgi:hypothetical protein